MFPSLCAWLRRLRFGRTAPRWALKKEWCGRAVTVPARAPGPKPLRASRGCRNCARPGPCSDGETVRECTDRGGEPGRGSVA